MLDERAHHQRGGGSLDAAGGEELAGDPIEIVRVAGDDAHQERLGDMIMRVARSNALAIPHQSTCPARRDGQHRFFPDSDVWRCADCRRGERLPEEVVQ